MPRVIVVVVAVLLILAVGLVVAPGNALAYRGAADVCKDYNNLWMSQGACVSYLQTLFNAGNADAVILCKDPVLGGAFRNQGECITALQRYGFN